MRGKAHSAKSAAYSSGITPAHAGKSKRNLGHYAQQWDHPRTCGEKVEEAARLDLWAGSPPHMRGKVLGRLGAFQARGITPAHAGKRSGYQTAI